MDERKDFTSEKSALRRKLIQKRAQIYSRAALESAATNNILPLIDGSVMLYAAIGSELSTELLFSELKRKKADIYLPYTSGVDIIPLKADKLESPNKLGNLSRDCYAGFDINSAVIPSICVVPLVGINPRGFRLGYGKGCYDRFFASFPHIRKIGLAFDCQRVEFKEQSHDIPLDCCVTESGVIYF